MRILIAEDSLTQAVDLRRRLEAAGHTVVVAGDGLKAWNHLSAQPEPLVISDWMMPELSGLDLCRKIRAEIQTPYIYFILLTAKSHRHERLQGLSAGADDFLTKPVDSIELDIALRTAQRIIAAQEALLSKASELQKRNEALSKEAAHDPQTGLRNPSGFQEALASACLQAASDGLPLTLIRLEVEGIDWLPANMDPHQVLVEVADLVRLQSRESDIAARFGERGFAIIVPGGSHDRGAELTNALRSAFAKRFGTDSGLTPSLGFATWTPGQGLANPTTLLEECETDLMAFPR